MKRFLLVLLLSLFGSTALASGYAPYYHVRNNTLYYRTYYPRQCYYGTRSYVTYYYRDKYVTDSTKTDWKTEMVRVANQIQENRTFVESFSKLLPYTAPLVQQMAYPQQQVMQYPSQTGNTVGGFSSYYGAQYGAVASVDANAALSKQFQAVDNVTRMATELGQMSNQVAVQAVAVTNINGERIGAIAELQEYRAALKEREVALSMREHRQNEFLMAIKPQPSAQNYGQSQGPSIYGPGQQPSPPPIDDGGFRSPQQPGGVPTPLFQQFCGRCHGSQAASPGGGWTWNQEPFDRVAWGDVYLRIDPGTPATTQDGTRPLRMPPAQSSQPSDEQRRQLVGELRQFVTFNQ